MSGDQHLGVETDAREIDRIRDVYQRRDERATTRPLGGPRREAYLRLNAQRLRRMAELVSQRYVGKPRMLDVGCGGGYDLRRWLEAGWPPDCLAGTDIVPGRLEIARDSCPGVDLRLSDGVAIPFDDATWDVVTATTVFSSIIDPTLRRRLFDEMRRVARAGGLVVVYDFVVRNPWNPDVVPMSMRRIRELGQRPSGSVRLSPFLYAVAAASVVHPMLADVAMRVSPPTHRLTWWRIGSSPDASTSDALEASA